MTNNLVSRALKALVVGLVTGFVAFVIIALISMLIPTVSLDAAKWGAVVGVLAGLISFVTGQNVLD